MPEDPQNPDSLSDDRTFTGEREATSEEQQSLGDDRTFAGEQDAPPDEQQSLGDQATAGDALSSISDLELDGQASDFDLPLIDLAARYKIESERLSIPPILSRSMSLSAMRKGPSWYWNMSVAEACLTGSRKASWR